MARFKVGDEVVITHDGTNSHRHYHKVGSKCRISADMGAGFFRLKAVGGTLSQIVTTDCFKSTTPLSFTNK